MHCVALPAYQPRSNNPLPTRAARNPPALHPQDPEILAYREHQATAARMSLAEEARTLVAYGK